MSRIRPRSSRRQRFAVVVLDAQQHPAADRTRGAPDVERVQHVAEVQPAGRRRCKSREPGASRKRRHRSIFPERCGASQGPGRAARSPGESNPQLQGADARAVWRGLLTGGYGVQLEGVYSVLPTPFTATGEVDDDSLRRVVDLFIGAGVNGVTVLGVTGEVARLDDRERQRVLEIVTGHVNGRIGVVAGTTAEGTRTCIGYSRHAKAAGATAVMVSPPRMPKLNSEAVVRHYHGPRRGRRHRIVVQDYPPISGYAMEPWLLARIATRDSARPHHQARGSADAVQDLAHPRTGRWPRGSDLRRPRRRVPARGVDGGRDRRDDRLRVSRAPRGRSSSCTAPAQVDEAAASSIARCR